MTTTDERALLAAIRANPDEDSVRLGYADWLDDHDRHDEAELIRVQVRLPTSWGCNPTPSRYCECQHCVAKRRETALVAKLAPRCPECHGTRCMMGPKIHPETCTCCEHCSGNGYIGTFERGFLVEVRVPLIETVMEQCKGCGGSGRVLVSSEGHGKHGKTVFGKCSACKGTGWLPTPYGRALVTEHPLLARVVPLDREPYHVHYPASSHTGATDFYRWWCFRNPDEAPEEYRSALLPEVVYEPLRGLMPFSTHTDAIAALATALADVLRELVGVQHE